MEKGSFVAHDAPGQFDVTARVRVRDRNKVSSAALADTRVRESCDPWGVRYGTANSWLALKIRLRHCGSGWHIECESHETINSIRRNLAGPLSLIVCPSMYRDVCTPNLHAFVGG